MELYRAEGVNQVIRHMFKFEEILVGSTWISSSSWRVKVTSAEDDWITYVDHNGIEHEKDTFSFQCRYCLVVEDHNDFLEKHPECELVHFL